MGKKVNWIPQLPRCAALRVALPVQGSLSRSDQHKFRDCVPGHKVLNCGWERGLESLPPSFLPSQRHHFRLHWAGMQGVKSARNLQDWSLRGGGGRRGGEKEKGEADCRETAPGTPSPGTWPPGPQPQKRPCPPGVVLSSLALPPPYSFVSPGGWAAGFPAKPWLPAQFFQTLQSGKAGALSG